MMQNTIDTLKEKVKSNLLEIQSNQKKIRELLNSEFTNERSEKLEEIYIVNKMLLAENNDLINVQLTLSNFVDKYNHSHLFETVSVQNHKKVVLNEQESFEKTVTGELTFNKEHPFYNSETFFQNLMNFYQTKEDYESCSKILKERD